MRTRLAHLWERTRSSLWFVPTVMSLASVGLAVAAARADRALQAAAGGPWARWLDPGSAEGARTLLATVAGSMMTVAGVTFSVTVVALSLASSQFGPRLLVNFMRDRGNQLVLGTFIATFLFCLVALAAGSLAGDPGVPAVSAALGLAFAVASIGVLIFFIHHVSSSIHAERVVEVVARELEAAIDRIFPPDRDEETVADGEAPPEEPDPASAAHVSAPAAGYIQAVDELSLIAMAEEAGLVLRALRRPGHFVVEGEPLLVALGGGEIPPALARRLAARFIVGRHRSQEQDPEYGIHQLVEVAVRALSPGVNDPYTAVSCVDWLGAILCRIAGRPLRAPTRRDGEGRPRLVVDPVTFEGVLAAAFNQIRQCAGSTPAVSMRILESLARVARHLDQADRREAVRAQVEMVFHAAAAGPLQECDRRDLEARHRQALEALGAAQ